MLKLFHSIFGHQNEAGNYPRDLIEQAIERAVDGTDPLLKGLFGYRKKLRPAVIRAMDHVVALGHGLAEPIVIDELKYDADPRLQTFFISSNQLHQTLRRDPDLKAYLEQTRPGDGRISVLLLMEMTETGGFGVERVGEMIVRDAPQVRISFAHHLLRDPAAGIDETRRLLKRRAFDHLLGLALEEMTMAAKQRADLERREQLLRSKVDLLRRGGWGLDPVSSEQKPDMGELQHQLKSIEAKLVALGGRSSLFKCNLDLLIDLLVRAEEWLWADKLDLIIDDMGIRRREAGRRTRTLQLDRISNARGRRLVVALLDLPEQALRQLS